MGASFSKQIGGATTPFGRREFLRSNRGLKFDSATIAMSTVPSTSIDGNSGQKILTPGLVIAKITSGPEQGKFGPFQAAGTQEVQTATYSAAATGGSYKYSFDGAQTAAILFNDNLATINAKVNALTTVLARGGAVVAGAIPSAGGSATITFNGPQGADVPQMTVDYSSLTGATITMSTATQGVSGATDGRQTLANIYGLLLTFDPWKTKYHDVDVSVMYGGEAVQGWCSQMQGDGSLIVPTTTTVQAMQRGGAAGLRCDIGWH